MGSQRNKLLLPLGGVPLITWTLRAVAAAHQIEWLGIISQAEDWPDLREILALVPLAVPVQLILGGATRQESVWRGLAALPLAAERVLIHDGARALATPELLDQCALALESTSALVAAVPVKDTIKVADPAGQWIESTPDRQRLWAAQTPQGFQVECLKGCHQQAQAEGWEVTDDAALLERCGLPVQIVMGEESNLKVTTPFDLAVAELILSRRHP